MVGNMGSRTAEPGGRAVVRNADGEAVELTSLWRKRRVVLCFLRHAGCRFCHQQWAALCGLEALMSEHGTTLVGVTLGTVAQAKALQELTGNRGALYVVDDRNREPVSYALMHLTHAKEFKDIVPADADALQDGALAQGFDDKPHFEGDAQQWAGDVLQLGGVFVLGPGNTCDYSFRSKHIGHTPPLEDVRAAVTGVLPSGEERQMATSKSWWSLLNVDERVDADISLAPMFNAPETRMLLMGCGSVMATTAIATAFIGPIARSLSTDAPSALTGVLVASVGALCGVSLLARSIAKQEGLPTLKLLSPEQIDRLMLEQGNVRCDCPAVLEDLPMTDAKSSLTDADDQPDATRDALTVCAKTLCYLREFLAQPHPHLGRSGATCPFVPKSLKLQSIYLTIIEDRLSLGQIISLIGRFLPEFEDLEPRLSKPTGMYKAVMFVFPWIAPSEAPLLIDQAQARLKDEFVEKGLMIGEFHAHNNTPGLHNENFYPLRTPFPTLTLRNMHPSDVIFLVNKKSHIDAYIRKFKDHPKSGAMEKYLAIAQDAKRELQEG